MNRMDKFRFAWIKENIKGCEKILDLGANNQKLYENAITLDKVGGDIQSDLEKGIPCESNTFDCVIAGELIEHIINTTNLIKEIHRVLTLNGKLIITTPNSASLRSRVYMLFGYLPPLSAKGQGGHIRDFSIRELEKLTKPYFETLIVQTRHIEIFKKLSLFFSFNIRSLGETIFYMGRKRENE